MKQVHRLSLPVYTLLKAILNGQTTIIPEELPIAMEAWFADYIHLNEINRTVRLNPLGLVLLSGEATQAEQMVDIAVTLDRTFQTTTMCRMDVHVFERLVMEYYGVSFSVWNEEDIRAAQFGGSCLVTTTQCDSANDHNFQQFKKNDIHDPVLLPAIMNDLAVNAIIPHGVWEIIVPKRKKDA